MYHDVKKYNVYDRVELMGTQITSLRRAYIQNLFC